MSKLSRLAGPSVLALGLLPMQAALAATDQEAVVDRARLTISDLQRDPEFGTAKDLMHRARAIIIVPQLLKAGFFFGGEGGKAVMLVHAGAGRWSAPAFYTHRLGIVRFADRARAVGNGGVRDEPEGARRDHA